MDENVALVRIYPNGTTNTIAPPIPSEGQAQALSAIDTARSLLYIVGYSFSLSKPNLLGIDLATGAVVSSVQLPFAESGFVGVGQKLVVEPNTGLVIVGGQMVVNGPHCVGFVDPKTGAYQQIANITSADLDVLGGAAVYVPALNSFVLQLGTADTINLFSVDMATGAVTQWNESFSNGANVETLDVDPVSGLIFGLGIEPNASSITRTLVSLDPAKQRWTVIGKVYDYTIESGGEAALDSDGRILYWIGQKTGAAPSDPFYLIGLNLQTAAVVSANVLCPDDASCPWQLEYFHGA